MFTEEILAAFLNRFDENKRSKMKDVFITSFKKHLDSCENALAEQNTQLLERSVHDIKSLCYTLETNEEGKKAEDIEHALKSARTTEAFHSLPSLIEDIGNIIAIMQQNA